MPDDPQPNTRRERDAHRHRELGNADPLMHLLKAANETPGHPVRASHEREALVEALMLLTHRVGELTRWVARLAKQAEQPPADNGTDPR